jgi:hypothetical protein
MAAIKSTNLVVKVPPYLLDKYRESSSNIGKTMAEMTREIMTAFVEGNLQIKRGAVYQRQQEQMQRQQEEVQKLYVA